jgi:membrane associated rhomboid family serine protease
VWSSGGYGRPSVTEPVTSTDEEYNWRCYRHPERDAGVKCRRCERAICPDCMISAPVGFQCPECVKGAPAVRTLRSMRTNPAATIALIAVNVGIFLLTSSDARLQGDLAVRAFEVADGEWWRLVTAGFLHFNALHLGFNMFLLWQLGEMLESSLGRLRFGLLYLAALLWGSVGALLLSPDALTGGASGAVFGLMGAAVLLLRRRGIDPMQAGIGGLLVINLLLTFRPGVSIGGHLGGLVGGAVLAWVFGETEDAPGLGATVAGALLVVGAGAGLWLASHPV